MSPKTILAVTIFLATSAHSEGAPRTSCMRSHTQNISRIVPQDVDSAKNLNWEGPAGTQGLTPTLVPDIPDNGNHNPGHFRLAYFYPSYTSALYTSSVDPAQATIEFKGPPETCGTTK
jgi:hypothetical protein